MNKLIKEIIKCRNNRKKGEIKIDFVMFNCFCYFNFKNYFNKELGK